MQRAYARLQERIQRRDLAGFNAMGGPGGPIDNPIQAFVAQITRLDAALPGTTLPLPG
jgi:hypothetical protein